MTSREFIERQFGVDNGKERWCSSIYKDSYGNIFSYGKHYPLLFKIAGEAFVNDSGYSVTTAKHIGWAKQATDYRAINVELDRPAIQIINDWYSTDEDKIRAVTRCLREQLERLQREAQSKKRKDTWVYENLQRRISDARENLDRAVYILNVVNSSTAWVEA